MIGILCVFFILSVSYLFWIAFLTKKLKSQYDQKVLDLEKLQEEFHAQDKKYHDLLSQKIHEVKLKNLSRDLICEFKKLIIEFERKEKKQTK